MSEAQAKQANLDYGLYDITMMSLVGGRQLQESRISETAYSINKYISNVNKSRSEIIAEVKNLRLAKDTGRATLDDIEEAMLKVDEWNSKYPPLFPETFAYIDETNIIEAADKERIAMKLTTEMYGVRTATDAAKNLRLLRLIEKYLGVIPDEAAIQKNLDMVNEHYQKEIQGR